MQILKHVTTILLFGFCANVIVTKINLSKKKKERFTNHTDISKELTIVKRRICQFLYAWCNCLETAFKKHLWSFKKHLCSFKKHLWSYKKHLWSFKKHLWSFKNHCGHSRNTCGYSINI
ncbi:unnamed protein product [Lymnaea stagnalis]|uniref:Uncharacterized protein n=1 Tax=Lymnaea stagnalis TaxID=6523 RepID=A0AAV2HUY3_LYMST